MNHVIRINLNLLPLGSYDIIIGMNWLAKHKAILNCFDNVYTFLAEDKIVRKVRGVIKPVSLRQISTMQLKRVYEKGL